MDTQETAARYDRLANWWQQHHQQSHYGLHALERAMQFAGNRDAALDVGCGSSGRFIQAFLDAGFQAEGLDISAQMLHLAQQLHPRVPFHHADIATWTPHKLYSLITAWDSTFHLPLEQQAPVLATLCQALEPDGVLLFTCGGGYTDGEVSGAFQGEEFEYSTLGVETFLRIIGEQDCTCRHLEYDQYPLQHVYIIAQRISAVR